MELRQLHYYVAVAEERHFGRAALRLFMTQPPLSRAIRQLETEVGVALFLRSSRGVELTYAGDIFLQEARKTLEQAAATLDATRRAGRGLTGLLRVGFTAPALYTVLPDAARLFHERYPDVKLILTEVCSGYQPDRLRSGELDLGLTMPALSEPGLISETLYTEPLIAALPRDHRLAAVPCLALSEFANEPFVLCPRPLGQGFLDRLDALCQASGFTPHIAQEASPQQTLLALIAAGWGVSLVPASLCSLHQEGIIYRRLHAPEPQIETCLIWDESTVSSSARRFAAAVRQSAAAFRQK